MVLSVRHIAKQTHEQGREQDEHRGVKDQTTRLGAPILGCNPAAKDTAGHLVRFGVGDQKEGEGWSQVKFDNTGHSY